MDSIFTFFTRNTSDLQERPALHINSQGGIIYSKSSYFHLFTDLQTILYYYTLQGHSSKVFLNKSLALVCTNIYHFLVYIFCASVINERII